MIAFANPIATRPLMLRLSTAAELMTADPLSFHKSDSLHRVTALLDFHELDAAPVIDDAGQLVGTVSAAACDAWEAYSRRTSPHGFSAADLDETDISEIVSPVVTFVPEDAPVREVIDALVQPKARYVFVVDDDRQLVGVVTMTDVLRHLSDGRDLRRVSRTAAAHLC